MYVNIIKTRKIQYGDLLEEVLSEYVKNLEENSVLAITSKIISVIEGRFVEKNKVDKYELIQAEAERILKTKKNQYNLYLTVKDNMLIPSAGIDESNAEGFYIMHPKHSQDTAELIWQALRAKHKINNFGVILTDSHVSIMRRGVTGIALAWCGFEPLYSYIGTPDISGKLLNVTQINIIDSLATMAVLAMGEGNELTPMAVIKNPLKTVFINRAPTAEERRAMVIDPEEDLYGPLIMAADWV